MIDIRQGDVIDVLRQLPAESVHCVVTSPPYWGLRDYGVDGQIGLEKTPAEYLAKMVAVFAEVRRVLRADGVCWVNMGDGYAGGNKSGGEASNGSSTLEGGKETQRIASAVAHRRDCGLKPKDLIGMPWRLAFALQADGWWLRSDCIWHKPNPMPESVTDRPTKAHEYVFLLTKAARYFYDAEAVKEESIYTWNSAKSTLAANGVKNVALNQSGQRRTAGADTFHLDAERSGRNLRTVWTIATQAYPGAHFATFPEALVERCILAGTSAHGCCGKCGAPWARIVESARTATRPGTDTKVTGDSMVDGNRDPQRHTTVTQTTGWQPSCKCEADLVPCAVLDPFAGSGTTLAVAFRMGRDSIGVELNAEYVEQAKRRFGKETDKVPLLAELS